MRIVDVRWQPYRLPLRTSLTTAHGSLTAREGAIVEVFSADGLFGLGEIAPLPEFGGGGLAEAIAALPDLAAHLRGLALEEALAFLQATQMDTITASIPAPTACGLESALLDVLSKARGCSVSHLLNDYAQGHAPQDRVLVNAVIGVTDIATAVAQAKKAIEAGFRCVKLKMGRESAQEIERVCAVRAAIGSTPHLRLDANAGWTFAQTRTILSGCAHCAIQYVEQPLPARDLADMRRLRGTVQIPIAVDEALSDLASARQVFAHEAADLLIIKPQLSGGLCVSRQIVQEAAEHGLQSVVTSSIEAGVGLVGALHLAATLPPDAPECGLATLHLLEDDLLMDDLPVQASSIAVPQGPGLGVRLDRGTLAKYAWDGKGTV